MPRFRTIWRTNKGRVLDPPLRVPGWNTNLTSVVLVHNAVIDCKPLDFCVGRLCRRRGKPSALSRFRRRVIGLCVARGTTAAASLHEMQLRYDCSWRGKWTAIAPLLKDGESERIRQSCRDGGTDAAASTAYWWRRSHVKATAQQQQQQRR